MYFPTLPQGVSKQDYIDAILNGNPSHAQLVFEENALHDDVTLTDEDIDLSAGIVMRTDINSDTDLNYGTVASTELSFTLINNTKVSSLYFNAGLASEYYRFQLNFGVEVNGETIWASQGYFEPNVPLVDYSDRIISITAYDDVRKLEVSADSVIATTLQTYTFPMQMHKFEIVMRSLLGTNNIQCDRTSSPPLNDNPFRSGMTCRELLSYICSANGYFGIADQFGRIQGKSYYVAMVDNDFYVVPSNNLFESNISSWTTESIGHYATYNSYDANDTVRTIYDGYTGVDAYVIDNPILSLEHMDETNVRSCLNTILDHNYVFRGYYGGERSTYNTGTIRTVGNWAVRCGDLIYVEQKRSNGTSWYAQMPIMSRTLTWNGSCIDEYEATGNAKRQDARAIAQASAHGGGGHSGGTGDYTELTNLPTVNGRTLIGNMPVSTLLSDGLILEGGYAAGFTPPNS